MPLEVARDPPVTFPLVAGQDSIALAGANVEVVPVRWITLMLGLSLLAILALVSLILIHQRGWLRKEIAEQSSELRKAHEHIKENLLFLQKVTDNVPGVIFSFHRSGDGSRYCFPYISDRVTEWFDLSPEDLKHDASALMARVHPEDAGPYLESIEASARALTPWRFQARLQVTDANYWWLDAQSMPEKQDDGSIIWYGYFNEIREQKQLEQALWAKERQFRLIVENANDIIYTLDARGTFTYVSPNWTTLLGHDHEEVQGQSFEPFVHPDDRPKCREFLQGVIREGTKRAGVDYRVRHSNGEFRWHTSNAAPIFDDLTGETIYLGIARDITGRKATEEEERYQNRFQQLIVRLSACFVDFGFGNIDPQIEYLLREIGEFFKVDRTYLFQFSDNRQTMSNTHEWCAPGIAPIIDSMQDVAIDDLSWWWQQIQEMVEHDQVLFINDVDELPDEAAAERELLQSQQVRSMFCVPVRINQQVIGFFGVDSVSLRQWRNDQADLLTVIANLISGALEKNRLEQEVINMSVTDPLTGLRNRRYLENRLRESVESRLRYGTDFAIALFDLDHFKAINDAHGHLVGDNILRLFATILHDCVRASDLATRFGGEEFLILFPDSSIDEARQSVERILEHTRQMHRRQDPNAPLAVTVSAGLAAASELEGELSQETIMLLADTRLYLAKRLGRDRLVDCNLASA